jgi:hypothetical protein
MDTEGWNFGIPLQMRAGFEATYITHIGLRLI